MNMQPFEIYTLTILSFYLAQPLSWMVDFFLRYEANFTING